MGRLRSRNSDSLRAAGLAALLTGFAAAVPASFVEAVAKVHPAVVSITTHRLRPTRPVEGKVPPVAQARTLGSGFFIDTSGHILTCNHVVAGYEGIVVKCWNGTECGPGEVKVVGRDPVTDLAVLRVESPHRVRVETGDSDSLRLGQWVAAVGSPYGQEGSVTVGVISGLGRWGLSKSSGPDFQDFIQTDALLNPGSSGGPLIDEQGRVVGVSSFVRLEGAVNTGIGFATPINLALEVAGQLVSRGKVVRGFLGTNTQPVTDEIQAALGLESTSGALVASVLPGRPADRAGIRPGDVILELDRQAVADVRWFQTETARRAPGDTITLRLLRKGEAMLAKAVLEAWPVAGTERRRAPPEQHWLGLMVRDPKEADRLRTGVDQGVVVEAVEPASPADKADLKPGDVITEVDLDAVQDAIGFAQAGQAKKELARPVLLRVFRGRNSSYIAVGP